MGRTLGAQNKDKPFRDALRRKVSEASGDPRRLMIIAEQLIVKAESGDVVAIKEFADRLDGKVPQGVIGGDAEDNPVRLIVVSGVPREEE